MKIAFLGNYTLDLIARELKKKIGELGFEAQFYVSGFNQYTQEILNKDSKLFRFNPSIVIFSIDSNALFEDTLNKIMDLKLSGTKDLALKRYQELKNLYEKLSLRFSDSLILINNFIELPKSLLGTSEYNSQFSQKEIIDILNLQLISFTKKYNNIRIFDLHSLFLLYGSDRMIDFRLNYIAKSPWSFFGLSKLAELYMRYIKAHIGLRKKCILLDLDNTLWGGIIGDDGLENIILSNDGEGKAYYDFQCGLLLLQKRGILLAICSKNSEEIAKEAIRRHPYMALRPEHFAAMRINWNNKAMNIREIAHELNIGLDSMVFLDDSPFERALVRDQLEEVTVPELPKDPSYYLDFLCGLDYFDFYDITDDDLNRSQMYKSNVERKKLQEESVNMESYLRSLNMIACIGEVDKFSLPRAAQLTQKTNQFNLTTRRYAETDLKSFQQDNQHKVYYLNLEDKFGDNGIVGVAILKIFKNKALVDTFLLSCRVLGRDVEKAFLYFLFTEIKKKGANYLTGEFIPTKKNMPCAGLYRDNGFEELDRGQWLLDMNSNSLECPPWIKIKEARVGE